jgi:ligand-binding SRPBCC domain-containing protein
MKIRQFNSEIWLPRSRAEVFEFFAEIANLDRITPPWLRFRTVTPAPIEMRVGALIDHHLRIRGIPIRWQSKITVWEPPARFVDEQVRGPYRLWRHEHEFEERDGGTLVRDRVQYAVLFDFFVHELLVRRDVEQIFTYRTEFLRRHFSDGNEGAEPDRS